VPLSGLRVVDLSVREGALASRLLADLGADVVRIDPDWSRGPVGVDRLYANANKRVVVDGGAIDDLIAEADVVFDARPPGAPALEVGEKAVAVRVTPFGTTGPRADWRGGDLVCAARAGMVFVNGASKGPPLTPFGEPVEAATALVAGVAALLALETRDRTGCGQTIDLGRFEAALAAVEHVTGLYRQTGRVQRRQGSLHWSRTFRIGRARDGFVLLTHLGDWTTLSQWVASECEVARWFLDPKWESVDHRKEHAEEIFGVLDLWLADRNVGETVEGAALRRIPFAPVLPPERLADDLQLRARRFTQSVVIAGETLPLPRPVARFSDCGSPLRRAPLVVGVEDVRASWRESSLQAEVAGVDRSGGGPPVDGRPLSGVTILDFTWVVAGPVATRILADQGARVIKVEHPRAADFGTRRGGLSGNLNRGKQSLVLDLSHRAAQDLAQRLAARSEVVIDNFSTRVMASWGLDYDSLRARRADAIAVRLTAFGLDGPARDHVGYGPTLQAMAGYPYLMPADDGTPSGWGYSWSDMAAGWAGALATLAALRHRRRTGRGQEVDVSQFENLVSLMGPSGVDLLSGRPACLPPGFGGIYRCAPEEGDDDRWIAIECEGADLADLLAREGESGAFAPGPGREEITRSLVAWIRRQRAEHLEARLQALGVPAAVVANGADVVADEHLAARGYFESVGAPGEGGHAFDGIPFRAQRGAGRIASPGPLCGEQSDLVLTEVLGLDRDEIEGLREQGVFG
jgi:crotonobetainyl-CoA:carnitine CoA-transferase CaiB-like acyl-CoA transferase